MKHKNCAPPPKEKKRKETSVIHSADSWGCLNPFDPGVIMMGGMLCDMKL